MDKITGNHFKLGDEFDKGIMTSGALILSMSGMIVLTPVIATGLSFMFEPALNFLHIDASIIASFFPVDAGGASLAREISGISSISRYNGIVVASMFGAAVCPAIPLSLQMVEKEYHEDVLMGLLCGFATVPVGCIVAGLMLKIPLDELLLNTVVLIVVSFFICFGLWKSPSLTGKIFGTIGKILMIFITVGLCVGILRQLLGYDLIKGIASIEESFVIVGNIAIILAGVFPLISILSRVLGKVFFKIGTILKLDNTSILGLVMSSANYIPVFSMVKNMNKKGRIMNMAFCVSGSFILGDHLAFVLAFDRAASLPMFVGKFISGAMALLLANAIYKNTKE